jgi:hypothetical protein
LSLQLQVVEAAQRELVEMVEVVDKNVSRNGGMEKEVGEVLAVVTEIVRL